MKTVKILKLLVVLSLIISSCSVTKIEKAYVATSHIQLPEMYIYQFRSLSGNEGLAIPTDSLRCQINDTVSIRTTYKKFLVFYNSTALIFYQKK